MRKSFFLSLVLIFLLPLSLYAQKGSITGNVTDAKTGEALVGANIMIQGTALGAASGVNGNFVIRNVPAGTYTLKATFIGYNVQTKEVQVTSGAKVTASFELEPKILVGEGITITANRAFERETPVSFSDVKQDKIKQQFTVQDVPHLFNTKPGIYVTSDGGSGMGDSDMRIRGFDMQRVQVMINNIPVNDPESKKVYWSNWGSLPATSQSIQIQRGVGSSLYGSGAFGGSVNVVTSEAPAIRTIKINATGGLYNTYKLGYEINSGLMSDKWAIQHTFNYLTGNGWRNDTHYKGLQYYLSLSGFLSEAHTIRFILHGAPQAHAYTYYSTGLSDYLKYGRDYNPHPYVKDDDPGLTDQTNSGTGIFDLAFKGISSASATPEGGEVIGNGLVSFDNNVYHKPQFEVHHSWKMNENTFLQSTAFFSLGRGYGENVNGYYRVSREADGTMTMANIIAAAASRSDIYQYRAYSIHNQMGLLSTLSTLWKDHKLSFGAEGRYWWARHYGTVVNTFGKATARIYVGNVGVNFRQGDVYYDYTGVKPQLSLYGHALWHFDKLSVMTDLQYSFRHYDITEDLPGSANYPTPNGTSNFVQNVSGGRNDGYVNSDTTWNLTDLSRDFSFVSPKVGVNYNFTDQLNAFANYSISYNEPRVKYFYAYGSPVDKDLLPIETSHDIELGFGFRNDLFAAKVNVYEILFQNKSLQITDPTKANTPGYDYKGRRYVEVGEAEYQGIELEGGINVMTGLNVGLSATLMRNRWGTDVADEGLANLYGNEAQAGVDFTDANSNGKLDFGETILTDLVDKYGQRYDVGTPQFILAGSMNYNHPEFFVSANARYYADYYILPDNGKIAIDGTYDKATDTFTATKESDTLDPWFIIDMIVGRNQPIFGYNATISLHVYNLLNTEFWQIGNDYGLLPGWERNIQLNLSFGL